MAQLRPRPVYPDDAVHRIVRWFRSAGLSVTMSAAIFFTVPIDRKPPDFSDAAVRMEMDRVTPSWQGAMARHDAQTRSDFSGFPLDAIDFWAKGKSLAAAPRSLEMLAALNAHFNTVTYTGSPSRAQLSDEWETPLEFISDGGDCEDYVIAKFLALREAGWPWKNRRIVVGEIEGGGHHAVLVVRLTETAPWYMLDNRTDKVVPVGAVADFIPFFGMSARSTWIYKRDWKAPVTGDSEQSNRISPAITDS
ncbi:transglutaminase-like cysteine peptidase [Iodidimonas sp. SYSU 1G8]|uniref:transglutaminase-like cysteine peptidase n=1 Tax=Iodidimonas sp. SYSU 1G8 TaxID=3133967 RepID=UPI0031FEC53F